MADRRLHVFHSVARLLSFTKAAETLHLTQPAVTFQIRQLEESFNIRLFERIHNRVALTQAGNIVYDYSNRIFDLYAEMERAVQELTGEDSGALTIGASTTVAEYLLPSLLGDFKDNHPEVTIHLKVSNTEGIVSMVENNSIDLGIVESQVSNKSLIIQPCRDDHLVVIVPPNHVLAKRDKLGFNEILEFPFICREEGSGTREVINEYMCNLENCNTGLKIAMELGSPEAVKGAVEAGMGVSVLSHATIQKELRLGTLIGIPLDPPLLRPFSFVYQRKKFRLHLIDELLEQAHLYCSQHQTNNHVAQEQVS